MHIRTIAAAAALVFVVAQAKAQIPYPDPGTIAPTESFTANSTGDVDGFFASKGGAGDTDYVRMIDVTTNTASAWTFDNQTTSIGTEADFGPVNAGDVLEFQLLNTSLTTVAFPGGIILSSIPADSFDGDNHAYSTAFAGGNLNGGTFPAGTYIGMEDEPASWNGNPNFSDFNYNDDSFVFTDVASAVATPEPNSFLLLGTGLLGLVEYGRRKLRA